MRAIPDRRLAEPYRSWADRRKPLPDDVLVLPRALTPWIDLFRFVALMVVFGAVGLFMLQPVSICFVKPDDATRIAGAAIYLLSLLFLLTPLLVFWEFLITLRALLDEKMGRLRQGILIGPSGILVRLKPNECCTIDMADFKEVRAHVSERDSKTELYRIETARGLIEFPTYRMESRPHVLSQIITRLGWKTHKTGG